ncbi:hypothetical protein FJY68_13810 [candidate division WOR-3 bacterium]|uniref:FlgD/Vpr Ig-like domain-containing protein n=1 Tax=candidate division WOR-3 bacterium TaxID=2052148 RepID=A0A937XJU8_UNCW3|nr:hypothetical protein [candidate division WOR-3 bacterium]
MKGRARPQQRARAHGTAVTAFFVAALLAATAVNASTIAQLGDPRATYPNSGRKLMRAPNTDNFHVVFNSGDTVLYSQSTDDGATWSGPEMVGLGKYPAITLNEVVGGNPQSPWIVYQTLDGSIMRAIRIAPTGGWDLAVVFPSGGGVSAGAPSIAADVVASSPSAISYVAYPVYTSTVPPFNYVYFNSLTQYSVSMPEVVDAAGTTNCYGPSVVVNPGSIVNVCWIRNQSVIYRRRMNSTWSTQVQISSSDPMQLPVTEPASNPSMEVYGDSVFCVWHGPSDSSLHGDVWRRARWLGNPVNLWRDPSNESRTPDWESDFPVMTTSFATVWQEDVLLEGRSDIWVRYLAEPSARSFYQSDLPSRYPHADGYWVPGTVQFKCSAVWTEMVDQLTPLFEVRFGVNYYAPSFGKGLGPGSHHGYEPFLYYAAELGQSLQSPYCLSRGGYAMLGTWDVDTSASTLRYQLPYMNPRQNYRLCAVLYHEGNESWSARVRCDSGSWTLVKTTPGVPDTVWLKIPEKTYKSDARIVVDLGRVTGDYVALAELRLLQIEDRSGNGEGSQNAGTTGKSAARLCSCAPSMSAGATSISYELACPGSVFLTVCDASGRLVRGLESGSRPAGVHVARWDGTDSRGHAVPAGAYFVRLSAGGAVSTERLTLVR